MSQNAKKEMQELIRKLRQHGIETKQLPNGHWRTDSNPSLTFSFSPSDPNAARQAYRDVRNRLGIDLRQVPKRKDSADDYSMQRIRERALKQMERGATTADLARVAVIESREKNIGGWPNTNSAEVGISNCLKGSRIVKANHNALAAALKKLESSDEKSFVKHLDKAADAFGKRRIPKHTPEPDRPKAYDAPGIPGDPPSQPLTHHPNPKIEQDSNLEESFETLLTRRELPAIPARVEITVKIEVGSETRQLIEQLLAR